MAVVAILCRGTFPFLSSAANFSLACALQWYLQLSAVGASKMRAQLSAFNGFVASLSAALLVCLAVNESLLCVHLCALGAPLLCAATGVVWHARGRRAEVKAHAS